MTQTRLLTFGRRTIALTYQGQSVADLVEFLYQRIPAEPTIPAHRQYQLSYHETDGFVCDSGAERLYQGDCRADLASHLLGDTGYHLADKCDGGLFFHAAGLAWHGQAVMLPGSSGQGKTTLTAWLLSQGAEYLTDEFIFLPHGGTQAEAFTRPLNLKRPARAVLRHLLDYEAQAERILSHETADIVPPDLLGSIHETGIAPLKLILFPHYQAEADFSLQRLSKAQTGLHLMQTVINARNLPNQGFSEISRLAQTVPAYALKYSQFEQLDERLMGLFAG